MNDKRRRFSLSGLLLLTVSAALTLCGFYLLHTVPDGLQYAVPAPQGKEALQALASDMEKALQSMAELTEETALSVRAQHKTLSGPMDAREVTVYAVTEGYFDLRLEPLLEGRYPRGDSPEIVLEQAMAYLLFPGGSAVGETVELAGTNWTVVGILRDKTRFGEADERAAFLSLPAALDAGISAQTIELLLRFPAGENAAALVKSALSAARDGGTFHDLASEKAAARMPLRWTAVVLLVLLLKGLTRRLIRWGKAEYAQYRTLLQTCYRRQLLGWLTLRLALLLIGSAAAGGVVLLVVHLLTEAALLFPHWIPEKPLSLPSYISRFWSIHRADAASVFCQTAESRAVALASTLFQASLFLLTAGGIAHLSAQFGRHERREKP